MMFSILFVVVDIEMAQEQKVKRETSREVRVE